MSFSPSSNVIYSKIWQEEPEPDNVFATQKAYCCGYDVYGEMLGQARWVEMLYLLFRLEPPTLIQANMLEALAVALANPGPRDTSVHAAMCGGVGGSPAAACLMAALGVGAGELSGGREIFFAMDGWRICGTDLQAWNEWFHSTKVMPGSIWPAPEHAPGYDPHGVKTAGIVKSTLMSLAAYKVGGYLPWLEQNYIDLEVYAGCPLNLSGVAAAAFSDLGFTPDQGEMLYLLLRLPGAAAHALEQRDYGHKKFPFGKIELEEKDLEGEDV
ncbi:MAG: citryl-CoA lyase [Pseudomonadota bacterium]